jgi:hypothetical protein
LSNLKSCIVLDMKQIENWSVENYSATVSDFLQMLYHNWLLCKNIVLTIIYDQMQIIFNLFLVFSSSTDICLLGVGLFPCNVPGMPVVAVYHAFNNPTLLPQFRAAGVGGSLPLGLLQYFLSIWGRFRFWRRIRHYRKVFYYTLWKFCL